MIGVFELLEGEPSRSDQALEHAGTGSHVLSLLSFSRRPVSIPFPFLPLLLLFYYEKVTRKNKLTGGTGEMPENFPVNRLAA